VAGEGTAGEGRGAGTFTITRGALPHGANWYWLDEHALLVVGEHLDAAAIGAAVREVLLQRGGQLAAEAV